MQGQSDPYEVAKSMGIFQLLESPKSITTTSVAQRIIANHEAYMVYLFFCNCFSWHEWPEIHQIVSHASKSDWELIFHALQWEKYVKEGPTKIFWNDSTLCRILVQLCCDVHILSSALLISRVITCCISFVLMQKRNAKKAVSEKKYYEQKMFVSGD